VRLLAEQVARTMGGRGLLDRGDLADIREELTESVELRRELDALWPTLSAEQLLTDLFADERKLGSVARRLSAQDRALLVRAPSAPDTPEGLRWSPADVPLLDEAAELLGDDGSEAAAREAAALREEIAYAQGVLDVLDLEEDLDDELLRAGDVVDADRLAQRQQVRRYDSTADRAAADREWTYGHVIVDEAQELSAMAWRLIMRRCPTRSMTLVGDIAQTGDLAGASSWGEVLSPYVANRWRLAQLTVNYRTPSEIAAVADDVLAVIEPGLAAPRSVRGTGVPPRAVRSSVADLEDTVAKVLAEEAGAVGEGRTAVLAPTGRVAALRERLLGSTPRALGPIGPDGPPDPDVDLESPVVVLPISSAKGLEFDAVVLVEPGEVLAQSPRGANDLYVALTRATQRLAVVHTGDLPAMLHRLDSAAVTAGSRRRR
jgi:DNA helicase IV